MAPLFRALQPVSRFSILFMALTMWCGPSQAAAADGGMFLHTAPGGTLPIASDDAAHPSLDPHAAWLLWSGPADDETRRDVTAYFVIAAIVALVLAVVVAILATRTDQRQRRLTASHHRQLQEAIEARSGDSHNTD